MIFRSNSSLAILDLLFTRGLIGIDRIHRIIQDLRNFFSVTDPKPDESKDPQLSIQKLIVFKNDPVFFIKIRIELGQRNQGKV